MSAHYSGKYRKGNYRPVRDDDHFQKVVVYLPKSLLLMLEAHCSKVSLPLSSVLGYAVDNEFDQEEPFRYPFELPTTPYVEYAFAKEAGKLITFLEKYPNGGIGKDKLLLHRRDIGINDKSKLLEAYRELLMKDFIEEYWPDKSRFRYDKSYKFARLKRLNPLAKLRKKVKALEDKEGKMYDEE